MSGPQAPEVSARGLPAAELLGIDHVVVVVTDLDAAVQRFTAVLGQASAVLGGPEAGYRRAMFELGASGQRIELCQPLDPDEPGGQSQASRSFRRRLETLGEGVHNVAVNVRDVHSARAVADQADIRVIESRHSDTFFLHPGDMCGALLQFMGPTGDSAEVGDPST
jgi:catechol 2,3-dioxygenase-like lactoylglutathione lyase family enzyme